MIHCILYIYIQYDVDDVRSGRTEKSAIIYIWVWKESRWHINSWMLWVSVVSWVLGRDIRTCVTLRQSSDSWSLFIIHLRTYVRIYSVYTVLRTYVGLLETGRSRNGTQRLNGAGAPFLTLVDYLSHGSGATGIIFLVFIPQILHTSSVNKVQYRLVLPAILSYQEVEKLVV